MRVSIVLPDDFPEIITLCGSSRFKSDHEKAQAMLGGQGKIVIPMSQYGHQNTEFDMDGPLKKMLDELHFRKIDLSDSIYVVNPHVIVCLQCNKPSRLYTVLSQDTDCCRSKKWEWRNYIGQSTYNEIAYAKEKGKSIYYLNKMEV